MEGIRGNVVAAIVEVSSRFSCQLSVGVAGTTAGPPSMIAPRRMPHKRGVAAGTGLHGHGAALGGQVGRRDALERELVRPVAAGELARAPTSRSAGVSVRQTSTTNGQRGWK